MRLGAHLPVLDLEGRAWELRALTQYVRLAHEMGFEAIAANDHLVHRRPWLDSIVALSSVLEAAEGMRIATTVALPVVRGPQQLASAARALHALSGGRLVLGVGAGSSRADHEAAGHNFDQRWPAFWEALVTLRALLADGPPIWLGSWGSTASLERATRLADGWVASAMHTTPAIVAARRVEHGLPCSVATAWTWVTDDPVDARRRLSQLSELVRVPVAHLAQRVPIGSREHCVSLVQAYMDAGVDTLYLWPLGDPVRGLERFAREVLPELSAQR